MNSKKGFTLIEVIVAISLISLIGISTTILIVNNYKNQEIKLLEKYSTTLENALNVYLDIHPEVITNLDENAKGAIVTLETLKNDGLISDNLNIEYKKYYYLLSNFKLLEDKNEDKTCDNDVIGIDMIKSWDLNKYDSKNVIYVCPKNNIDESILNSKITSLEEKINILENAIANNKYIFKGNVENNYVKFEYDSKDYLYSYGKWDITEGNENLFRIMSYYGTENNNHNLKIISANQLKLYRSTISIYTGASSYLFEGDESAKKVRKIVEDSNKKTIWGTLDNCKKTSEYENNKVFILKYEEGNLLVYTFTHDSRYYKTYSKFNKIYNGTGNILKVLNDLEETKCNVSKSEIVSTSDFYNDFTLYYTDGRSKYYDTYYIEIPGRGYNQYIHNRINDIKSSFFHSDWIFGNIKIIEYSDYQNSLIDNFKTYLKKKKKSPYSIINNSYGFLKTLDGNYYELIGGDGTLNSNVEYYPIIDLKNEISFKKDTTCSNGTNDGTKNCPYILYDTTK